MVISEIRNHCAAGYSFNDIAIFYRTHAQSRQFEDVLRREKVPYRVFGGLRFYDRKEIKDVLSYFKVVINPSDSVSLKRIINVPGRGIGKTSLDKMDELATEMQAQDAKATYFDVVCRVAREPSLLSPALSRKLQPFVAMLARLTEEQPKMTLSDLYHLILDETGYVRDLRSEATEESSSRIENLEEFDTIVQEFDEKYATLSRPELLPLFLEESTLATSADESGESGLAGVVNMMTLHSSKGLEYPIVFMVGMEEGLFPSIRQWEEPDEEDIEEERRLCYVGMTRARERLYMSHVVVRRLWGNVNYQEPARFFSEIPDELIDFKDLSFGGRNVSTRFTEATLSPAPTSAPSQRKSGDADLVGRKLDHPQYGSGTIIGAEGHGQDCKVTIEFANRDRRKFLLRFVENWL